MTDSVSQGERLTLQLRLRRLHVCLLCRWYIGHWPMNDLSDSEWKDQLENESAWGAFLEGWCRD